MIRDAFDYFKGMRYQVEYFKGILEGFHQYFRLVNPDQIEGYIEAVILDHPQVWRMDNSELTAQGTSPRLVMNFIEATPITAEEYHAATEKCFETYHN